MFFIFAFISLLLIPLFPAYSGVDLREPAENMVFVKGGCFQMGDIFSDAPSSEKPVHEVCVDDFYMGKYEVTVGEFREFVEKTGYISEAEQQEAIGAGRRIPQRGLGGRLTKQPGRAQRKRDGSQ